MHERPSQTPKETTGNIVPDQLHPRRSPDDPQKGKAAIQAWDSFINTQETAPGPGSRPGKSEQKTKPQDRPGSYFSPEQMPKILRELQSFAQGKEKRFKDNPIKPEELDIAIQGILGNPSATEKRLLKDIAGDLTDGLKRLLYVALSLVFDRIKESRRYGPREWQYRPLAPGEQATRILRKLGFLSKAIDERFTSTPISHQELAAAIQRIFNERKQDYKNLIDFIAHRDFFELLEKPDIVATAAVIEEIQRSRRYNKADLTSPPRKLTNEWKYRPLVPGRQATTILRKLGFLSQAIDERFTPNPISYQELAAAIDKIFNDPLRREEYKQALAFISHYNFFELLETRHSGATLMSALLVLEEIRHSRGYIKTGSNSPVSGSSSSQTPRSASPAPRDISQDKEPQNKGKWQYEPLMPGRQATLILQNLNTMADQTQSPLFRFNPISLGELNLAVKGILGERYKTYPILRNYPGNLFDLLAKGNYVVIVSVLSDIKKSRKATGNDQLDQTSSTNGAVPGDTKDQDRQERWEWPYLPEEYAEEIRGILQNGAPILRDISYSEINKAIFIVLNYSEALRTSYNVPRDPGELFRLLRDADPRIVNLLAGEIRGQRPFAQLSSVKQTPPDISEPDVTTGNPPTVSQDQLDEQEKENEKKKMSVQNVQRRLGNRFPGSQRTTYEEIFDAALNVYAEPKNGFESISTLFDRLQQNDQTAIGLVVKEIIGIRLEAAKKDEAAFFDNLIMDTNGIPSANREMALREVSEDERALFVIGIIAKTLQEYGDTDNMILTEFLREVIRENQTLQNSETTGKVIGQILNIAGKMIELRSGISRKKTVGDVTTSGEINFSPELPSDLNAKLAELMVHTTRESALSSDEITPFMIDQFCRLRLNVIVSTIRYLSSLQPNANPRLKARRAEAIAILRLEEEALRGIIEMGIVNGEIGKKTGRTHLLTYDRIRSSSSGSTSRDGKGSQ